MRMRIWDKIYTRGTHVLLAFYFSLSFKFKQVKLAPLRNTWLARCTCDWAYRWNGTILLSQSNDGRVKKSEGSLSSQLQKAPGVKKRPKRNPKNQTVFILILTSALTLTFNYFIPPKSECLNPHFLPVVWSSGHDSLNLLLSHCLDCPNVQASFFPFFALLLIAHKSTPNITSMHCIIN